MTEDPTCPLAYFVKGMPRMITRGYGCGASGGRCSPHENCDNLRAEFEQANNSPPEEWIVDALDRHS